MRSLPFGPSLGASPSRCCCPRAHPKCPTPPSPVSWHSWPQSSACSHKAVHQPSQCRRQKGRGGGAGGGREGEGEEGGERKGGKGERAGERQKRGRKRTSKREEDCKELSSLCRYFDHKRKYLVLIFPDERGRQGGRRGSSGDPGKCRQARDQKLDVCRSLLCSAG